MCLPIKYTFSPAGRFLWQRSLLLPPNSLALSSSAFQNPQHHQNIANPCALILGAVMMLNHLKEHKAADRIEKAVSQVIEDGNFVTKDINPTNFVGTKEMGEAIVKELDRQ